MKAQFYGYSIGDYERLLENGTSISNSETKEEVSDSKERKRSKILALLIVNSLFFDFFYFPKSGVPIILARDSSLKEKNRKEKHLFFSHYDS
ncbi:unnamed protein product [Sphenostylis stenocarpa]|uniref:Uncharacterized protein n=1 Tax=Sphenostylis stenocarpa TaxID=92480 RepID=A0AA86SHT4_9FABA|nr:unnamed protein product [Sphenostylis stenocarpa]